MCANPAPLAKVRGREAVPPRFINLAGEEIRYEADSKDRTILAMAGEFNADYWRGRVAGIMNVPRALIQIGELDKELRGEDLGGGARQVLVKHMEFAAVKSTMEAMERRGSRGREDVNRALDELGEDEREAFVFQREYLRWPLQAVFDSEAVGERLQRAFLKWPVDDRDIFLEIMRNVGVRLDFASKRLRDDREMVLGAVQENGYSLEFASERLRDDREIVLGALKASGYALQVASERLRDDREMLLKAVQENAFVLEFASRRLQDDNEIVLRAVQGKGLVLQFASKRLRDDREIVLGAVQQNRIALHFASERLQGDGELRQR